MRLLKVILSGDACGWYVLDENHVFWERERNAGVTWSQIVGRFGIRCGGLLRAGTHPFGQTKRSERIELGLEILNSLDVGSESGYARISRSANEFPGIRHDNYQELVEIRITLSNFIRKI